MRFILTTENVTYKLITRTCSSVVCIAVWDGAERAKGSRGAGAGCSRNESNSWIRRFRHEMWVLFSPADISRKPNARERGVETRGDYVFNSKAFVAGDRNVRRDRRNHARAGGRSRDARSSAGRGNCSR